MARFLITTMPFVGHVNPGLPVASRLIERGHEVRWYTGRRFRERVEATGARVVGAGGFRRTLDAALAQEPGGGGRSTAP